MSSYWLNDRDPLVAWQTYANYRSECDRGIAHTDEWAAQMEELEEELRKTQEDLRLIQGVMYRGDKARGEFPKAAL